MRRANPLLLLAIGLLALLLTWIGCAGPTTRKAAQPRIGPTLVHPDPNEQAPVPERPHVSPVPADEGPALVPDEHAVAVHVTLPGGTGLAGATIQVTGRSVDWGARPEERRSATTDSRGRCELGLPAGSYVVRASHDRYQIVGQDLDVPDDELIELSAGAGPRVTIVVEDDTGAAIDGALVWELHESAGRVATTDSDGRASLGRVYPWNPFVIVDAPGFARWSNYVFGTWDGRDTFERRVTLHPGRSVMVRVLDHDGAPCVGSIARSGAGSAVTRDDGRADVPLPVRGDSAWLRAERGDGREVRATIPLPPPEGDVVEMRLPPPEPVRGRVLDLRTGEGVSGVTVFAQPDFSTEFVELATSGPDGRFSAEHLDLDSDGEARMVAFGAGVAVTGEGWADHRAAGDDGEFVLRVAPTMTLTGRALDRRGDPVAGARVLLTYRDGTLPLGAPGPETLSTADGSFSLTAVPAVADLIVLADGTRGIGWQDHDVEIDAAPGSSQDVGAIVIPDGFDLDVPIVDDDGAPVASAIVWVRWRIVTRGTPAAHRLVLDGRMDPIRDIPRDSAVAEITAPGLPKTVQRVDASTESLVANLPCTISGRVVRRTTSEPVAGVWVIVESKDQLHTLDGNHGGAKTSADGTFSFGGVRRGTYRLRITTDEHERLDGDTDEIHVGARDVALGDLVVD